VQTSYPPHPFWRVRSIWDRIRIRLSIPATLLDIRLNLFLNKKYFTISIRTKYFMEINSFSSRMLKLDFINLVSDPDLAVKNPDLDLIKMLRILNPGYTHL
jgi:hypothetical protein